MLLFGDRIDGQAGLDGWGTTSIPAFRHVGQGAFNSSRFGFSTRCSADSVDRFMVYEDGHLEWGAGGSSARDVGLYRSAAAVLKTDQALHAGSGFTTPDDGNGLTTFGAGRFYKKTGTGLVTRMASGDVRMQVENNAGTILGTYWDSGNLPASTLGKSILNGSDGPSVRGAIGSQAELFKTTFETYFGNGTTTAGWCKLGTFTGNGQSRFEIKITGKQGWNDNDFASHAILHGGTNYISADNGQIAAGCKWIESLGSLPVAAQIALVRQAGYIPHKFDLYILNDAMYAGWLVEVTSIGNGNSWSTGVAWQQTDPGTGSNVFKPTRYVIWDSGTLTNLNQLTNGPGFISANQTITLSGDASGSGATSIAVTVAKINVSEHSTNNTEYPVVWDNNSRQLLHTAAKMTFNPSLGRLTATAFAGPLTGNASTATTLLNSRTFALTGVITASAVSFNGSANVSLATAIADGALSIAKTSGLQAELNGLNVGTAFEGTDPFTSRGSFNGRGGVRTATGVGPFGNIWYNMVDVRHRNSWSSPVDIWGGELVWGMTSSTSRMSFRSRGNDGTPSSWTEVATQSWVSAAYVPKDSGGLVVNNDATQFSVRNPDSDLCTVDIDNGRTRIFMDDRTSIDKLDVADFEVDFALANLLSVGFDNIVSASASLGSTSRVFQRINGASNVTLTLPLPSLGKLFIISGESADTGAPVTEAITPAFASSIRYVNSSGVCTTIGAGTLLQVKGRTILLIGASSTQWRVVGGIQ